MLARLRAALFEAGDVGELERHVHALLEFAAVVGERERRLERHGVGRNVISPPQLGGIDPELVGGEIDKPLDHIGGLGATIPAIGPNRIGVREHGRDIGMHGGNAIDPRKRADIAGEGGHSGLQVSTDAGNRRGAHGEKAALLVERELGLRDVIAGLGVAQKGFQARGHPLHRAPSCFDASSTSARSL